MPNHLEPLQEIDGTEVKVIASVAAQLGNEVRYSIVQLLLARERLSVKALMALVGLPRSNVSFHLESLGEAGIVTSKKSGKFRLYSLSEEKLAPLFSFLRTCTQTPESSDDSPILA